jgi:hypothetical protein
MGGEAPRDCFSQRKWGNEVVGLPKKKKKDTIKENKKGKKKGGMWQRGEWCAAAWVAMHYGRWLGRVGMAAGVCL